MTNMQMYLKIYFYNTYFINIIEYISSKKNNGGIHRLVWKSQEVEWPYIRFIYANIPKNAFAALNKGYVKLENLFLSGH